MTEVVARPPRSKIGLISTLLLVSAVCFLLGFYAARFLAGSGADPAPPGESPSPGSRRSDQLGTGGGTTDAH